jgi:hypothetical protein
MPSWHRHTGNQYMELGQSDPIPTAQKIAKQTNVSEKTIKRDAKLAQAIDTIKKNASQLDMKYKNWATTQAGEDRASTTGR